MIVIVFVDLAQTIMFFFNIIYDFGLKRKKKFLENSFRKFTYLKCYHQDI
jgi:hypothetical protein